MANPRDQTPVLTQAQRDALHELGFPDALLPHFTAEELVKVLHNIRTPEEMRRFIGGGGAPTAPPDALEPDHDIPKAPEPKPDDGGEAPFKPNHNEAGDRPTEEGARKTLDELFDESTTGEFFFDIETRAKFNIRSVGSARYLRDADTQIRLICWALDDGPVQHWRWGDPIEPLRAAIRIAKRFVAHNLPFDRTAWNLDLVPLGLPPIPLEQCEDTSAMCRAIGIPASLEGAAKALLPPQFHKAGKSVMHKMSRPRLPWPGEDPNELYWVDDPQSWAELDAYTTQDVEVLRALYRVLPPLPKIERPVWLCDQIVNERGLYLDGVAITRACERIDIRRREANARLHELTNGEIATTDQHEKIRIWANARGARLENMQAESLEAELARTDLTPEVRSILELRLEAAQAAAAKPIRMRAYRCADGRARHTLVYCQAGTGRWAGTGVQFQNVKKEGDEIASKFAAILNGEDVSLKDIGDAGRGFVCAEPDYELFGGDYSGFESAYLATIAGERWKIEAWAKFFRTRDPHDDPYFIIGKLLGFADDVARDYGKIADLAFGFGGSVGAWRRFAPPGDTTSDEQIKKYRDIWRAKHPAIVRFWYGLEAAAIAAMREPQQFARHKLYCRKTGNLNFLFIELPSGRAIAYPDARLVYGEHNGRPTVSIGFMDNAQGRWKPYASPTGKPGSWFGLLTENVVQGRTRDIMAATMLRLEAAGYEVVLTVHDEIVCQMCKGTGSLEQFKLLLEQQPDWAEATGMPLNAKVWRRERWAEDVSIPVEHVPGGIITPDMLAKPQRIKAPNQLRRTKPIPRTKTKRPSPDVEAPCSSHQPTTPIETTVGMTADEAAPVPDFTVPPESDGAPRFVKGNGQPPPASGKPGALPDRAGAARFLNLLDPTTTRFTFQTFDDDKERKSEALARVRNGTLDEHFAELTRLNNLGAGIFVTVCETNLCGRLTTDILKVRLLFIDCDGTPLPRDGPKLYVTVQSSPDRFHGYWKSNGVDLDAFTPTQELIAKRFGGDPTVKDLPRVMRLPGFWHRKGEPFMVRILEVHADAPACSAADFETDEFKYQAKARQDDVDVEGLGPWAILNTLALANLDKWVPELFGDTAVYQPGTGAYRVSSEALGRDLEEDLSIHPKGIRDWGIDDQGGAHQGGRTPIDLVSEYRGIDADTAFDWLDVQLREVQKPKQLPTWDPKALRVSYSNVRHRRWLYGTYLMRGQVTIIAAPGGVGKTALTTGIATEIATSVVLMDDKIWGDNLKVLSISGEDDKEEITRRMWAFARAHVDKITEQPPDRFYAIGVEDDRVQHMSFLRTNERNKSTLDNTGFAILESALDALRPDVLMLDPLVAFCSGGNMNDNAVMAQVMRRLKSLAIKFDCAILIVHHNKKGGERDDQESISGAASIVNLARCALMPIPMTTEEATKLGVLPSERHRYFRLVNAKPNFTPKSEDSPWYRLHSIELPNPEPPLYDYGDNLQAVARVNLPLPKTAVEAASDQKVQRAILDLVDRGKLIEGERYPYSPNITGAKNMRGLLEDAIAVAHHATAPKQWRPNDLKAVVLAAIGKMKGDGWLYEEMIERGRFRQRSALYVAWQATPWPRRPPRLMLVPRTRTRTRCPTSRGRLCCVAACRVPSFAYFTLYFAPIRAFLKWQNQLLSEVLEQWLFIAQNQ
jgi:DNA polymerase